MEAIILSKDQFNEINQRLDEISKTIKDGSQNANRFIDNCQFLELMKISKRTAQGWRDEGKIAYSQIGGKIYYRYSDIEQLLSKTHNSAFAIEIHTRLHR